LFTEGVDHQNGVIKRLHRTEFIADLKEAFPELQEKINREAGLLHLEMSAFTRFVQNRINAGDKDALGRALKLADHYVRYGNKKLVNAIMVSFLEHLNFEDGKVPRQWAWDFMTPALRARYHEIMTYNEQLLEKE